MLTTGSRCRCSHPRFTIEKEPPRTNNEIGPTGGPELPLTKDEEATLEKWADVFDGHSLNLPDLKAEPRTASLVTYKTLSQLTLIPDHPNTRTDVQGRPINLETAKALRRVLFGDATHTFTRDWEKFRFYFRSPDSSIPYGISADLPGSRALALCVQAYIIKHLLFTVSEEDDKIFGRAPPDPTEKEQESTLVDAISDMLWKVTPGLKSGDSAVEKRNVTITIRGDDPCFETLGFLLADGLIEKLWLFTLHTKDELREFVGKNLRFFCDEGEPGGILLIYSLVLSHTPEAIVSELGNCQRSLMTENAKPTQAFVNFLLSGHASCFVHNGTIRYDRHGRELAIPLPGPKHRSEMGYLCYDKTEDDDKRTIVGCMLRTPLLPIWLTKVNGSFGLMFCTSRDLVADWKTERFFTIHYYTGHFSQINATSISVDTRRRAFMDSSKEISYWDDEEEKERKQPSLERLLGTKWPEAVLDWNGETPYY